MGGREVWFVGCDMGMEQRGHRTDLSPFRVEVPLVWHCPLSPAIGYALGVNRFELSAHVVDDGRRSAGKVRVIDGPGRRQRPEEDFFTRGLWKFQESREASAAGRVFGRK